MASRREIPVAANRADLSYIHTDANLPPDTKSSSA